MIPYEKGDGHIKAAFNVGINVPPRNGCDIFYRILILFSGS